MGRAEPYKHKVQYYETDQMGMGYEEMEKRGIMSPVLSVSADYLRMVHFGDVVEITEAELS